MAENHPELAPAPPEADYIPRMTYGLLSAMAVGYVLSLLLAVRPGPGFFSPSAVTLWSLGGVSREAVLSGEYQRLLLPWLLHGDLMHLLFNATALIFAGPFVERFVGRSYMLTVFFCSVVGGAVASVTAHADKTVGIGASGGLMGVIVAAYIASRRLPANPALDDFRKSILFMLVFALLPIATVSGTIDVAAHVGGALVGFVIATLYHALWRVDSPLPPGRPLLRATAAAGIACTVVGAVLQLGPYAAQRGDERFDAGRPEAAVWWLEVGDRWGSSDATNMLGYFHRDGVGMPKDGPAALALFKRSADRGNTVGLEQMGEILYYGEGGVPADVPAGVAALEAAAARNNAEALYLLGFDHRVGERVPKDLAQSRIYLERAAALGHLAATVSLGYTYMEGLGVPKDEARAFTYFQTAAVKGEPRAQKNVAEMYERGRGVDANGELAYAWFLATSQSAEFRGEATAGLARLAKQLTPEALARAKGLKVMPKSK